MVRKSFLIATAIALALCGGLTFSSGAPEQRATPASMPKIRTFIFLEQSTGQYTINDNPYIAYVKQKTGLDFDITRTGSAEYGDKLNVMLASGEVPDLFVGSRFRIAEWAGEGFIAALDDLIPRTTYLKANISQGSWDTATYQGKIYAVPNQRWDKWPYLNFVRTDYLKNLGVDAQNVRTIDDYYALLKSIAEKDPDKDGQRNTIALTSTLSDALLGGPFRDAFDAYTYKYINGELVPSWLQTGFKEWLKFENKLYRENLLDQEFVTQSQEQLASKLMSGKVGMFSWFWHLDMLMNKNEKAENWTPLKPPLKRDGSESRLFYHSAARQYVFISSKCQYKDRIVQMLDWACSEEGQVYMLAGVEGFDYDLKDGQIAIRPDMKGKNYSWRSLAVFGMDMPKISTEKTQKLLALSYGDTRVGWYKFTDQCGAYDPVEIKLPGFPELDKYDLYTRWNEYALNAVVGKVDVDATWDQYVVGYRKNGGDQEIQLLTEWSKKEFEK